MLSGAVHHQLGRRHRQRRPPYNRDQPACELAAASGPILGGILVATVGWRAIFYVNLPVAAAAFVLVARYAPETKAPRPRRIDLPGQLLLIVTLAALTYAVIEGPARGWGSGMIIGLFAVAVVGLTIFVLVERRRAEPLLERAVGS